MQEMTGYGVATISGYGVAAIGGYGVATISRLLKMIGLSFAEYSFFYWARLQKKPIILRSLLIVASPQVYFYMFLSRVIRWCSVVCRAAQWLRLVGSSQLQVSFAEYRLFYRALLQKRPTLI